MCGILGLTLPAPPAHPQSRPSRCRSRRTRAANVGSVAMCRGERPAAITTNGSSATALVQRAGSEISCPWSSRKQTRSWLQAWRWETSSNSRPHSGWNGCVTRTRPPRSTVPGAVDRLDEDPFHQGRPRETRRTRRRRRPISGDRPQACPGRPAFLVDSFSHAGDNLRAPPGVGSRYILLRDRQKSPSTTAGTHCTARLPA